MLLLERMDMLMPSSRLADSCQRDMRGDMPLKRLVESEASKEGIVELINDREYSQSKDK